MLSLRGQAPCRSLSTASPCRSARTSCTPFKHITHRHSLHTYRQAPVRTPCFGALNDTSKDRSGVSCSAQPEFEEHTPEIVEDSDLPAHLPLPQGSSDAHQLQPSSGPQRLASWALGHQQKGITTLLGFAGVALAGIAGEQVALGQSLCLPAADVFVLVVGAV